MKRTQYFKWGLTAFLTVCAVLVFYDTFYQAGTLQQFVSKLASILAPVLYGFAIAYLLTPIMSCLERAIAALWKKLFKKELKQPSGALRLVSILLTEAVVIFLLYLLMSVLVPQVVDSVTTLINNAESYYRKVYRWANDLLESDSGIGVWLAGLITERYTDGMAFLTDKVLPWAQKAIVPLTNGIWSGIRGAVGFAFDLIVGIIVSIYLMGMKEKSLARCCKAVYAALPEEKADAVMRGTRRVNAIFSGLCPRQTAGLPHHRHPLLYLLLHPENALHAAGQRGGGRDQRDPLLRALPGRGAVGIPDPAGQPQAMSGVRDLHRDPPAI